MSHKVWIQRLSFNLSRDIRWRMVVILMFGLLSVAGLRESSAGALTHYVSVPAQKQDRKAAEEKFKEGETLQAQGTVESLRLAVKRYEEALLLWRTAGDHSGEAQALINIGIVYVLLGENQKAPDFFNQALPLLRKVGDPYREGATLFSIGLVYNSLGERRKALDFFNQALPLHRKVDNRKLEAMTLQLIGLGYESIDEKLKALDFFNQALPLLPQSW